MQFNNLDLTERLLIARRGTAWFAQAVAELPDASLDHNSLLPDWSRRHLLAHVGHNAAALCRLLDWAATGVETPMYKSPDQRTREINEGATWSPTALRNLFTHTATQLDEKWSHLPQSAWSTEIRTAQGRLVPVTETVWMRTREVWIHAVDLANGTRFGDIPPVILDSLLDDIVTAWRRKGLGAGLVLAVTDRAPLSVHPESVPEQTVTGPLPAAVRWSAGRGAIGVRFDGPNDPPPIWL